MAIDLISSLLKYPSKTAPIKIGPVNAQVRPTKPAKREKGGKISVARGKERERGEHGREEFSSRWKPFPLRGNPRRERKTPGEREGEREKQRDKERERRKERDRGELLSRRK